MGTRKITTRGTRGLLALLGAAWVALSACGPGPFGIPDSGTGGIAPNVVLIGGQSATAPGQIAPMAGSIPTPGNLSQVTVTLRSTTNLAAAPIVKNFPVSPPGSSGFGTVSDVPPDDYTIQIDYFAGSVTIYSDATLLVPVTVSPGTLATPTVPLYSSTPGTLDASFGAAHTGYVTSAGTGQDAIVKGVVQDPATGAIYLVGSSQLASVNNMTVWKYDKTGAPVTTFGNGGNNWKTFPSFGTPSQGNGGALDANGNLIVVGSSTNPPGAQGFCNASSLCATVWRILPTGTLDTSFGQLNGIGPARLGYDGHSALGTPTAANAVVLDSSGSIYVAGTTTGASVYMVAWKYLPTNSSWDVCFGNNSAPASCNKSYLSAADITPTAVPSQGNAIALDGTKVVVAGTGLSAVVDQGAMVWRIVPGAGGGSTVNASFDILDSGAGKHYMTSGGSADLGNGIAVAGGKYIVAGALTTAPSNLLIFRYNVPNNTSAATLDPGFNGGTGLTIINGANNVAAQAITLDPSGSMLVAGLDAGGVAVWKILATGALDGTNFASGATTPGTFQFSGTASSGGIDSGMSILISPITGKILVGGGAASNTGTNQIGALWSVNR